MSRYTEKNSFDDEGDANPFADPAVKSHTSPGAGAYGGGSYAGGGTFYQEPTVAPAKPTPLPPEPASVTSFASDSATVDIPLGEPGYKKKEKELKAKEKELQKKEAELKKREEDARRAGVIIDTKNWPFFFPIMHHDIAADIPENLQWTQRLAYWTYLGLLLCFLWNTVCVSAAWAKGVVSGGSGFVCWLAAILYAIAGIILAWILWYRRLYNAMRKDRALTFAWFFLMYMVHIAWCIFAAISPPIFIKGNSLTGFLSFIKALDKDTVIGIMYLVGCILWVLEALVSIVVLQRVYAYFRGTGKGAEVKRQGARAVVQAAV
jgi:hypothetical protein